MTEKIKPHLIELVHATGVIPDGDDYGVTAGTKATAQSYEEAEEVVRAWQHKNPVGRVEDVDYMIYFEDGQTMAGSFEIGTREGSGPIFTSFVREITANMIILTNGDPQHDNFRSFVDPTGVRAARARQALETYDFGLAAEPSQTLKP